MNSLTANLREPAPLRTRRPGGAAWGTGDPAYGTDAADWSAGGPAHATDSADYATPNPHDFDAALGGQRATVVARWVSTAGDPGPWSPPVSALIQP